MKRYSMEEWHSGGVREVEDVAGDWVRRRDIDAVLLSADALIIAYLTTGGEDAAWARAVRQVLAAAIDGSLPRRSGLVMGQAMEKTASAKLEACADKLLALREKQVGIIYEEVCVDGKKEAAQED